MGTISAINKKFFRVEILLIAVMFSISSCGFIEDSNTAEEDVKTGPTEINEAPATFQPALSLDGSINDIHGNPIDLKQFSNDHKVLIMFSLTLCFSCLSETEDWIEKFNLNPDLKSDIKVLTVLIGDEVDKDKWLNNFNPPISWTVGVDFTKEFFKSHFPVPNEEIVAPSYVLFDPSKGGIFHKVLGEILSVEEVLKLMDISEEVVQ